jgi:hypothetical protein
MKATEEYCWAITQAATDYVVVCSSFDLSCAPLCTEHSRTYVHSVRTGATFRRALNHLEGGYCVSRGAYVLT